MALEFILGRAGSGKSTKLFKTMIDESMSKEDYRFVAIVPDQYSLEAQKEILDLHPNHGSFNIEVTSFSRLARTVFEEQGYNGFDVMDDLKKSFLIRKALLECENDLKFYKKNVRMTGFTDKVKSLLSELEQYDISDDELEKMIEYSKDKNVLKSKLEDVITIKNAFEKNLDDKKITSNGILEKFTEYIDKSDLIKKTYIYIDGFTGFTPNQLNVLEKLMVNSPNVMIALTIPKDEIDFFEVNPFSLFALSQETIKDLKTRALKNNVDIVMPEIKEDVAYRIKDNAALSFVEDNIFRNYGAVFDDNQDSIEIYEADNTKEEVRILANRIEKLVREEELNYKDIAVITGDIEGYYRYIEEYFGKYEIPYFMDHKKNISANPFVDLLVALVVMAEENFSYESLYHVLRLKVTNIEDKDINVFENELIKRKRMSFNSFAQKWGGKFKGNDKEKEKEYYKYIDYINSIREKIYVTFKDFMSQMKAKNATIRDFCAALYKMVEKLDIKAQIRSYKSDFEREGLNVLEKEYDQVYETIINLLDKLVEVLGDEKVTINEFRMILSAGAESMKIGTIPPKADCVMVGDIERTRLKDTKKVIMLLGANEGIIPKTGSTATIISDSDREFLADFKFAPTSKENNFIQRLYLYSLLAKPTEKMIVSYARKNASNEILRKSYLVNNLKNMFNGLEIFDDNRKIEASDILNKRIAYDYLADKSFQFRTRVQEDLFVDVLNFFDEDDEVINAIKEGATFWIKKDDEWVRTKEPFISKETALKLFGDKDRFRISSLQDFASCPYKHFVNYGLRLRDREEYQLDDREIGTIYHSILEKVFDKYEKDDKLISEASVDELKNVTDMYVEEVISDSERSEYLTEGIKSKFMQSQIKHTAEKTVEMLARQLKEDKFKPTSVEESNEGGIADRIDTAYVGDNAYVKVIDYKTGKIDKEFTYENLIAGLKMQVFIYLKDAIDREKKKDKAKGKNVIPAGAFYFHVSNPFVEDKEDDKSNDKEIYKEFRMRGVINDDAVNKVISSDVLVSPNLVTTDEFNSILSYVDEKVNELRNEAASENIDIIPYKGSFDSCKQCRNKSICQVNEGKHKTREIKKLEKEEAMKIITGEE